MGAKHCVGLANGLDALWMSVHLLDIGPGDEVIVCSNAYIACVMGITKAGATPVFVEPDEYDNLDAEKIEAAITPRTKAVMPVHLYGMSCDMGRVMEIARKHHLRVIEDCAQAHGTHFHGKTLGTFGDVGCFSFYPTKGLGAFGDGGCILTDDEALAEKFRTFRNYGSSVRYHFDVVGANSRLDELQAGLLRVKLTHLDEMNAGAEPDRRPVSDRHYESLRPSAPHPPGQRQHVAPVCHPHRVPGRIGCVSSPAGNRHGDSLPDSAPSEQGLRLSGLPSGALFPLPSAMRTKC